MSLTPYYRYDTQDFNLVPSAASPNPFFLADAKRHTFALRYVLRPGSIMKGEYQVNGEAENADVADDIFLASYIQQF